MDCKYCTGDIKDREGIARNFTGETVMKINELNYLEDIENSDREFIAGMRFNYCPECGRKLSE